MEQTCVDTSLNLNVSPSGSTPKAAKAMVEELQRLSCENKRLNERLIHMYESYNALRKQLMELNKNCEEEQTQLRKRKAECTDQNCFNMFGNTECSSSEEESCKRPREATAPKISRVLVRIEASDTSLYVKDGYQWRKYGQKVTRDNPSPRAYFKCSYAPSCPVKKKVQRSLEDPNVLVATYEGEHNHGHGTELSLVSSPCEAMGSVAVSPGGMNRSGGQSLGIDLIKSGLVDNAQKSIQQILVQQMATSLTRDPNFTSALATAISGRILDQTSSGK